MATIAPTSNIMAQALNTPWVSKNDDIMRDQYKFLFDQYGEGMKALDFFESIGRVMYFSSQDVKAILRGAPIATVKTGAEVATGSAGADITFAVHSDSHDSANNIPVRVGDTLLIPAAFMPAAVHNDRLYSVTEITGTTTKTVVASPLTGTSSTYTNSQISTAIPSGTTLAIGATNFGRGTAGTTGKVDSYTTYSYKSQIMKDALGVEGGRVALDTELINVGESQKALSLELMAAEFRLDKQKEFAFVKGEINENSGLTAASSYGGTNSITGTDGIYTLADKLAQKYYYTDAMGVMDFDAIKLLFESRGVTSPAATIFTGSPVVTDLENSGLDFIREFSNSDLLEKVNNKLGIVIERIKKNGIEYKLVSPQSFRNPASFGLNVGDSYSYALPTSALIIPDENVTTREFNGEMNKSIPNVVIGYVNSNGEDRSNIMSVEPGVNGFIPGSTVANSYDGVKFHWLTEMFTIAGGVEKWVLARKA